MWSLHFSNPKNRYKKGFSPYTGLLLTDALSDELLSRPALLFVGDLGFFLRPCDFFFEYAIGDFAGTVFFLFLCRRLHSETSSSAARVRFRRRFGCRRFHHFSRDKNKPQICVRGICSFIFLKSIYIFETIVIFNNYSNN